MKNRPAPVSASVSVSTSLAAAGPRGCTNLKLRQLTRRVGRIYDEHLAGVGLKTTQYSLLSTIVRMSAARSVEVAQALQLQPSSLSRNLRPLVHEGWVEFQPGEDARSHRLVATPAGLAKREQAQRQWKAAQLQVNALLGSARVVALHALIDELLLAMDGLDDGPPEEQV